MILDREKIHAHHGDLATDPHHRYRSWGTLFPFFPESYGRPATATKGSMQRFSSGFYLASWGTVQKQLLAAACLYGPLGSRG